MTFKNVCSDDPNGKGLHHWRSVNNNHAEDDANNDNVVERGATAADYRDDGGNGKEDCLNNDNGGGDDWGDVNVDNNSGDVASLLPCLPLIIVKSDGDRNGGGRLMRRRSGLPPRH